MKNWFSRFKKEPDWYDTQQAPEENDPQNVMMFHGLTLPISTKLTLYQQAIWRKFKDCLERSISLGNSCFMFDNSGRLLLYRQDEIFDHLIRDVGGAVARVLLDNFEEQLGIKSKYAMDEIPDNQLPTPAIIRESFAQLEKEWWLLDINNEIGQRLVEWKRKYNVTIST